MCVVVRVNPVNPDAHHVRQCMATKHTFREEIGGAETAINTLNSAVAEVRLRNRRVCHAVSDI